MENKYKKKALTRDIKIKLEKMVNIFLKLEILGVFSQQFETKQLRRFKLLCQISTH